MWLFSTRKRLTASARRSDRSWLKGKLPLASVWLAMTNTRSLNSGLDSALPSLTTSGMACALMTAELESKLISRSMRSCFVSVMAAIFSRSSMVSERVTRLRTLLMKRSSSSLRAASAGHRVRLRVMRPLLAAVSAFTICSSLTSPARADPVAAVQASAAPSSAQTVPNLRFPVCAAIVTLRLVGQPPHSADGIPEELVDDIGLNVFGRYRDRRRRYRCCAVWQARGHQATMPDLG